MDIGAALVGLLIGAIVGVAIGVVALRTYQNNQANNWRKQIEDERRATVEKATQQAAEIVRESEEKARKLIAESEEIATRRRRELDKEDERLQNRRAALDQRVEKLEQREQNLNKRQSRLDKQQNDLEKLEEEHRQELQRIAQMTIEEARNELLAAAVKDARNDMARIIRQVEADTREEADGRASNVISHAVQRLASERLRAISL